ncbi:LuxR C-terminal-related transcriptional regulator [Paenibacillus sp. NPDC057967]|uniref:LuxR C-terminal-related transcriptional regulator n=1 Tax=Paenibacillus sp. NPDC057967 TaxID=3346293 RepID=UPI0036D778F4
MNMPRAEVKNRFVGRAREKAWLEEWLDDAEAPLSLLAITGIGGVGKSTLLSEYMRISSERGVLCLWLDGRHLLPSPLAFMDHLTAALALEAGGYHAAAPLAPLLKATPKKRVLVCIDNYEDMRMLERWMMDAFIPKLSRQGVMVVLASRPAFSIDWSSHPQLGEAYRLIKLENFNRVETERYWITVDKGQGDHPLREASLYDLTDGHPLTLALTMDTLGQNGELHLLAQGTCHISSQLSARMLQELAGSGLLPLVDVLSVLHTANQEELVHVSGSGVSITEFQALAGFSFIRQTPGGITLHDSARLHLLRDLKLREPGRLHALRDRAMSMLHSRLQQYENPAMRLRIATQMLQICREALPLLNRQYADISAEPFTGSLDLPCKEDLPMLHELLRQWCEYSIDPEQTVKYYRLLDELYLHSPESIAVLRDREGEPIGMIIVTLLHRETSALLARSEFDELEECEAVMDVFVTPEEADTHLAVLVAARGDHPGYTREELIGHMILDRLSLLGEGTRVLLVATNNHLKAFLLGLGFVASPAVTGKCDTSFAESELLSLDHRSGGFGIWAMNFWRKAHSAAKEPAGLPLELTEREKEVLQWMAEGASNKEIATRLIVTSETVKTHVRNIFRKLDVDRRMKAVAKAEKLNLLKP